MEQENGAMQQKALETAATASRSRRKDAKGAPCF